MNSKLINALAEFSDFHVGNEHYNKSPKEQQRIFMEFFAELIVQECISAVEDTNDRHRRDYFAAKIKQHFGIEE